MVKQIHFNTEARDALKKGVATISAKPRKLSIGAATELEMKEKKDRVDDALSATKATDDGYNAQSEHYEKLYQSGVIDPTKVTRIALENAASIAGFLMRTECIVFEKPQHNNMNE